MQFIVAYDRPKMTLVAFKSFPDSACEEALQCKVQLEHDYANSSEVEVAYFESASEQMLRLTHSRYFDTLAKLADNVAESA